MEKEIKKLIKEFKKLKSELKVKYEENNFAGIEIYNSGGLISVLELHEFSEYIDLLNKS